MVGGAAAVVAAAAAASGGVFLCLHEEMRVVLYFEAFKHQTDRRSFSYNCGRNMGRSRSWTRLRRGGVAFLFLVCRIVRTLKVCEKGIVFSDSQGSVQTCSMSDDQPPKL